MPTDLSSAALDLTERQRHALEHATDRRMSYRPLGAPQSVACAGRWSTTVAVERYQGTPWLWIAGAIRLHEPDAAQFGGRPMLVSHWATGLRTEADEILAELLKGVGTPFDAHAYMAKCGVSPGSLVARPLWRELTYAEVRVVHCGWL